jgi:hypothetical protein
MTLKEYIAIASREDLCKRILQMDAEKKAMQTRYEKQLASMGKAFEQFADPNQTLDPLYFEPILERVVAGAIVNTIKTHGTVTSRDALSVSKRVIGSIRGFLKHYVIQRKVN